MLAVLVWLFQRSCNMAIASSPLLEMFTGWFINALFVTCKSWFCAVTNERAGEVAGPGSQTGAPACPRGVTRFPLFSICKGCKRRLLLRCLHNLSKRFMLPVPQNVLCRFICQWVLIGGIKMGFFWPTELGAVSTDPLSPEPPHSRRYAGCPGALPELWKCLEGQVVPGRGGSGEV